MSTRCLESHPQLTLTVSRLCHIVHGPHNEAFHNLWYQLRSEQENLMRKGYTGEGFLSTGHKLGGGRIPMHEARRRARAAAEKRQALNAGSGQKLGGAPVRRGADIRKVIADAATRRITVTKGCASGTDRSRGLVEETTKNGFRTKAEEENANEEAIMQAYIEMIQQEEREKYGEGYVPPSRSNPAGSQGRAISLDTDSEDGGERPPLVPVDTKPERQKDSVPSIPVKTTPTSLDTWSCKICTLVNPINYLCCDACGTERLSSSFTTAEPPPSPKPSRTALPHKIPTSRNTTNKSSKSISTLSALSAAESKKPLGWVCHRCGNFMENEWWTCAGCGSMKQSS